MAEKIHHFGEGPRGGQVYVFHCPGCESGHPFEVPHWEWNGSMTAPTFRPSLLCNGSNSQRRCHSFVTDGKIEFLTDCYHSLAGQTVEIPDWDE